MDAQLKKGILEMCILRYVEQHSPYGYDILQMMHRYFPEVSESTLYAILRRLHSEGATATFTGEVSKGPARKYYRITDAGQQRLAQMKEDWHRLQAIVSQLGL